LSELVQPVRRTIGKHKELWVGWDRMKAIVDRGLSIRLDGSRATAGELIAVLFSGGFRISEVVKSHHGGLKPEQLSIYEKTRVLRFKNVQQMKRYEKIQGTGYLCHETGPHRDNFGRWHGGRHDETHKHFETKRKDGEEILRQSFAPLKEPFVQTIIELRDRTPPGSYLFDFGRVSGWRLTQETDPSTWPHWYRSQRAAQLSDLEENGGYEFNSDALQEYFNWTTSEMAGIYAKKSTEKLERMVPH
jgi:hypothetical protein